MTVTGQATIPARTTTRMVSAIALVAALSACSGPLDLDVRGGLGGSVDTSDAAVNAVEPRPEPDSRGVISYSTYQVAVARRGDTVADVAARVGIPATELASYNGIQTGDSLRRGEIIALPSRVGEAAPGGTVTGPNSPAQVDVETLAGNAIDSAPASNTSQSQPASSQSGGVEPVRHRVARGETAFTIARLYNVSPRALAEWNALDEQFTIREGQYLLIPVTSGEQSSTRSRATDETNAPGSQSPTPTPPSASTPLPEDTSGNTGSSSQSGSSSSSSSSEPQEPVADIGQDQAPASSGAMQMPVQGSIIREYAAGVNEGIDISASAGTQVKAAAGGSVAYLGRMSDGKLTVLIRHPDNVITVYKNLEATVQQGDTVSRGQTIGTVSEGDPSFVHFEVRNGMDSTDPMPYLR